MICQVYPGPPCSAISFPGVSLEGWSLTTMTVSSQEEEAACRSRTQVETGTREVQHKSRTLHIPEAHRSWKTQDPESPSLHVS